MGNMSSILKRSLIGIPVAVLMILGCSKPSFHDALVAGDENALMDKLNKGADINEINKDGLTPLHVAVRKNDTLATFFLLDHGASIDIPDKEGQTALQNAFTGFFGSDLLTSIEATNTKEPGDPSAKVLAMVMNVYREQTARKFDQKGILSVGMEFTGFSSEGGLNLISHVNLNSENKSYEINLSKMETQYINSEKHITDAGWNIVLRPGNDYRIVGTESNGTIEAFSLEFIGPPLKDEKLTVPVTKWLPSTWKMITELPWYRELTGR